MRSTPVSVSPKPTKKASQNAKPLAFSWDIDAIVVPDGDAKDIKGSLQKYNELMIDLMRFDEQLENWRGLAVWSKGQILLEVKKLVPHGKWQDYCREHRIKDSTARLYMAIARTFTRLLAIQLGYEEMRAQLYPSFRAALDEKIAADEPAEDGEVTPKRRKGKSKAKQNPNLKEPGNYIASIYKQTASLFKLSRARIKTCSSHEHEAIRAKAQAMKISQIRRVLGHIEKNFMEQAASATDAAGRETREEIKHRNKKRRK
jgi:hypothetical protein